MTHATRRAVRALLLLLLCSAAPAHVASAQNTGAGAGGSSGTPLTNPGQIIPFLEGTDVFFSLREDTVFEADILPHLVVFQNFTSVLDIRQQTARLGQGVRTFGFSVSGTPAVRLRLFGTGSGPGRTPSYMPRGNGQLIWARNVGAVGAGFGGATGAAAAAAAPVPSGPADQVSLWEAHAIVGHHSNGQDGCFFQDEERIGEECVSVTPVAGERLVNTRDGSFSTNYVRLGVNYRRNVLDDQLWAMREWGFRADVEHHPRAWMDPQIVDLYGRTRATLAGTFASRELSWCPRRVEMTAGVTHIHGHPESVWPVAVTSQFTCFPTREGGWGLFVRYYGGQDYYNLGLLENIQRIHVGATFNQSGFFRFRRREEDAR